MDKRDKLIKQFVNRNSLSAREQNTRERPPRITEDDPRWNPKTMGNKRGRMAPRPSMRYHHNTKSHWA